MRDVIVKFQLYSLYYVNFILGGCDEGDRYDGIHCSAMENSSNVKVR